MRRDVRDQSGLLKGWTEDCGSYIEARDCCGRYLGRYDKSSQITYDFCGSVYSRGYNDTAALIADSWAENKRKVYGIN